jgi:tRNA uridine 5-carbamoylmethylation protein Kti12
MISKQFKKYKITVPKQYDDEIEYWKHISPDEKLSILQELREQYIQLFNKQELYNESRKGLRRVYKITKLLKC